ncbi:MAG: preprotein translocase subunit YajC [Terriglobales bacterium]
MPFALIGMGVSALLPGLWAQSSTTAAGGGIGLLMILVVFAIFYFLLIMPVQRRQKKVRSMHQALKPGDRVVTSGGIRGIIISIKDDSLQLRCAPDQLKLEFVRSAIAQVITEEAAASGRGSKS